MIGKGDGKYECTKVRAADVEVPESRWCRHLGLPREEASSVSRLMDEARTWYERNGRPWLCWRRLKLAALEPTRVVLDGGVQLQSELLARGLGRAAAEGLIVVAASAGQTADEEIRSLWDRELPDCAMVLSAYASSVVETLREEWVRDLGERLAAEGEFVLPYYSPGYDGWDISEQRKLFAALYGAGPGERIVTPDGLFGVQESGGLSHAKSTFFVVATTHQWSDELARADFWEHTAGEMAVKEYEGATPGGDATEGGIPTERGAREDRVAFPHRALERWAAQRLRIRKNDSDGWTASFLFSGTTCANLGLSIELVYELDFARDESSNEFRIRGGRCTPSTGDGGYREMCAYLTNAEALMAELVMPPAFVGKTLGELLGWQSNAPSAGCVCTSSYRAHKWRMVLYTLHHFINKTKHGTKSWDKIFSKP